MWQKFVGMATITLVVCGLLTCAVAPVQAQPKSPAKFAVGDVVYFELNGRTIQGRVVGYSDEFRMYRVEYFEAVFNPEPKAVLDQPKKTERYLSASDLSKTKPLPPKADNATPAGTIKTPQAELNDRGDIVVPGLGGMRFAANGDIFNGDGKKLFDSATGKWAEDNKGPSGSFVRAAIQETDPNLSIGRIQFSDDDRLVAVQWSDGIIRLHNVADGARTEVVGNVHISSLKRYEFKEQVGGRAIVNGAYVGHGFVRKNWVVVVSEKTIQTLLIGEIDQILIAANTADDVDRVFQAFAVRSDGGAVAVASRRITDIREGWKDLRVEFFDPLANGPKSADDRKARQNKVGGIDGEVSAMAYSPDGKFLAINGIGPGFTKDREHIVEVWGVQGGHFTLNADGGLLAFSPDGKFLVTGRQIHQLRYTAQEAAEKGIGRLVKLKTPLMPNAVVYDPKGKWIAIGGADRRLAFWDPATGEKLASVRAADRNITSLAVSHDGATIATTTNYPIWEDGEATMWDVAAILKAAPKEETLAQLAATPKALDAFDFGLAWAQDGLNPGQKKGKETTAAAKSLGVSVPAFPPATPVAAFMQKFGEQGQALAAEIKKLHGASHEQLFTLGMQLNLVARMYRPDAAAKNLPTVGAFQKTIEQCCRDLGLTDAITRRLTARIAANDNVSNIGYEFLQIAIEVRSILATEPPDQK